MAYDIRGDGDTPFEFSVTGFIEFENFINTYEKQETEDANVKNELRGKFDVRFGKEYVYIYSAVNAYIVSSLFSDELAQDYFYSDKNDVSENLRISSEDWEISFNELYFNYGRGNYRIRIGNQIYGWGTADLINPTAYFNPMDMREMMFRGEDEIKLGVPSVSMMIFLDEYTLEAVVVPYHVVSAYPPKKSYWDIEFSASGLDIVLDDLHPLDKTWKNVGAGARLSTSVNGTDISISAYHGPDAEALMVPTRSQGVRYTEIQASLFSSEVSILVEPEYHLYNAFGFDFSKSIDSWTVILEAAYSPDRWGLIEKKTDDLEDTEDYLNLLPFETKESHFLAVSAGVNYFVPVEKVFESYQGMTILMAGIFAAHYFDSDLMVPFLGRTIALGLTSTMLEDKLVITVGSVFDTVSKGFFIYPTVKYDFQNGLSTEFSYAEISGIESSGDEIGNILYTLKDKDVFMWRLRYDF